MSLPSGVGAPCRHCLGALVEEIDGEHWSCSAGRVHEAEVEDGGPAAVPRTVQGKDLEIAQAFAAASTAVEAARVAWVAAKLSGDHMQAMEQASHALWCSLVEHGSVDWEHENG